MEAAFEKASDASYCTIALCWNAQRSRRALRAGVAERGAPQDREGAFLRRRHVRFKLLLPVGWSALPLS
jgi:hypothetical protein